MDAMNTLPATVAFIAGILTSVALETVPGVKEAWARQSAKRLVLFVTHTLAPVIVWALACYVAFPFSFPVSCGRDGLFQMMAVGVSALAGNQGTFAFAVRHLPRVKARNKRDAWSLLERAGGLRPVGSHDTNPFAAQDPPVASCCLCRLAAGHGGEIVTRLWLYRYRDVIVVTDLNAKHFAMRALAVPAEHVSCAEADEAIIKRVAGALDEARAIIESEHELQIVKRDLHRHSITDHYHGQDCYAHPRDSEPWK